MNVLKGFVWMQDVLRGGSVAPGGGSQLFSRLWIGRVLLIWIVLLVPSIPPFRSLGSVLVWVRPYYYASYTELGFIKRGLLGTVLTVTGLNRVLPVTLTVLVAHALLALAVAVLMVVLLRLAFGARPPRWSTPLQIAGLLSPDLKGGFSMELTASVFDNMKIAADNFKISSALGGTPLVGGYFLSSWPDCGI